MKIAILGGAFDPPHLGHQLIAQQILDCIEIDLVWLAPCYHHTFDKNLTRVDYRVAMTKMLVNGKIQYCGEEIDHRLSGDTLELMAILRQKNPQDQFSFIIGSDNLKTFQKWAQWEKLAKTTKFLVFPRPEFDYNLEKYGLDNPQYQLDLINHPLLVMTNVSSSKIRERIRRGFSISGIVPKEVEQYIKKHGLYR